MVRVPLRTQPHPLIPWLWGLRCSLILCMIVWVLLRAQLHSRSPSLMDWGDPVLLFPAASFSHGMVILFYEHFVYHFGLNKFSQRCENKILVKRFIIFLLTSFAFFYACVGKLEEKYWTFWFHYTNSLTSFELLKNDKNHDNNKSQKFSKVLNPSQIPLDLSSILEFLKYDWNFS